MSKKKLNLPLLRRLRTRFLRMRHPEHFDMDAVAQKTECGAALCIAGHALQLDGFTLKFNKHDEAIWFRPNGRRIYGPLMPIAGKRLGLREREWHPLFTDFSLTTPRQAAKRIEKIIAEAEA